MSVTMKWDDSGFRDMVVKLLDTTKLDLRSIVRAEAGSILKAAAGATKVSKPAVVEANTYIRVLKALGLTRVGTGRGVTINAGLRGQRGRVWMRSTSAGTTSSGRKGRWRLAGRVGEGHRFTSSWYHWRDQDWRDIQEAVMDLEAHYNRDLPMAKRAIGLARQSFVQIADDAGIRLEHVRGGHLSAAGIAKARAAIASNGQRYLNGQAHHYERARAFTLELVNSHPRGVQMGLDRALARAINGRVAYFKKNMEKGVFDQLYAISRQYPNLGIRVSRF